MLREHFGGGRKPRPQRFHRNHEFQKCDQIMCVGELNPRLLKSRFEVFFHRLLCVKTGAFVVGRLSRSYLTLRGDEVSFGLLHPFARE